MVDETPFYTTDTLYLAWWIINNGPNGTKTNAGMSIYLDGQIIYTDIIAPLGASQVASCCTCASIGPLSAGTHSIRLVVDTGNAINESNEADNEYTKAITIVRKWAIDFEGDTKTDLTVWRPGGAYWYILSSKDGSIITEQWGAGYDPYNDVPVPGDYDGDGVTDLAVWRPGEGYWYIISSKDGSIKSQQWGAGYAPYNDVPVPGDYDGDGKTDIAVWRPGEGEGFWYIIRSSDGGIIQTQWGAGSLNDDPISQ